MNNNGLCSQILPLFNLKYFVPQNLPQNIRQVFKKLFSNCNSFLHNKEQFA